jgi:hypothetical protein
MKRFVLVIALCGISIFSFSQVKESSNEIGLWGGGSYYIGDLNKTHYSCTHFAGGFLYRRNFNKRLTLRMNVSYGTVSGADSLAGDDAIKSRNLSFRSRVVEIGPILEVNFISYAPGNTRKDFASLYLFAGLNYFNMNPQGKLEDEWFDLQPLGTEGQGSEINSKEYKLNQLSIPLGIGLRWNITKRICLSLEYGIRKTFTDYLDDVSGYYVDPTDLSRENGALAAYFADMSTDGVQRAGSLRGNPKNKDWYSFSGLAVTIRLGNGDKCRGAQ